MYEAHRGHDHPVLLTLIFMLLRQLLEDKISSMLCY